MGVKREETASARDGYCPHCCKSSSKFGDGGGAGRVGTSFAGKVQ